MSAKNQRSERLTIAKNNALPKTWILLGNQSTVNVFQNASLLTNIRQNKSYMGIHCNAGVASTNMIGDLAGYGTVWYHADGIANILLLSRVKSRYRVTIDSQDGDEFRVHKPNGDIRIFAAAKRGLYCMDTAANSTGTLLVNTVDDNKSKYTNRDYSRAVLA
jgi:hypothetical protein